MLYEICDIQWISHEIHQSTRILLKTKEFHRISWNKQDLTHFYKIQHNFTKTIRIYGNPEISKDFMKSYSILLKATEFYWISLNSLQISLQILLQISLWMSFMDFTVDFITDFTTFFIMDFTANFMLNLPDFIIYVMAISLHLPGFHQNQQDFMKSTAFYRISLKSTGFHYGFHFGFHSSGRSTDFIPEIWQISWNPLDSMPETL